ncbi:O-antigen ligase family protein [Flavobacterium sp. CYK-55]|uniref:O-antigen ligase family protein n=1 Tax=Flavobacterium sp. CYK-55 TaxID=2835529 RepID=UPI001BCF493E|nr:O-antigen ligase family protein [Flavobacterium sp. CYK-55]MBS7787521.1 O-antigen ligase family protein [Flavobacterium sp. CYK-55]
MILTHNKINHFILFLLLLVLPIDMINGILLENHVNLPISISQIHKIIILGLMLFKLSFEPNKLDVIFFAFAALFIGSLIESFRSLKFGFLFSDFIKVTKYLNIPIAFFYFKGVIKTNDEALLKDIFRFVRFSYWVLAINISLKVFNLGYPMYDYGNIGTRGFFYAGNEISSLLLVTSSIIGYQYWEIEKNRVKFFRFFFLNLFLAILVSSKTVFLGVFIVFLLITTNIRTFKIKINTLKRILFFLLVIFPTIIYSVFKLMAKSAIMVRVQYFWEKLDFITFVFSSRNLFTLQMFQIYDSTYTLTQKILGGGQNYYESKLKHIIEIDLMDIFFGYGYLGATMFVLMICFLVAQSSMLKKHLIFPYARLTYFMVILLFVISSIAGHIFNSGIAGNFIGLLFALMYLRKNEEQHTL